MNELRDELEVVRKVKAFLDEDLTAEYTEFLEAEEPVNPRMPPYLSS